MTRKIATSRFAAAIAVSAALWAWPATAADFQEYAYPENGFAIHFPEAPKIETITYKSGDTSVPATRYSAQSEGAVYSLIVADFSKTSIGEKSKDEALAELRAQGEIKIDVVEKQNTGAFGHQLTVANKDGSRSYVSLFFTSGRLYRLEGISLPPDPDETLGDTLRFQESLRFTDKPPVCDGIEFHCQGR